MGDTFIGDSRALISIDFPLNRTIIYLNVLVTMKTKRATIIDVAEKAGVSIAAVSFAFNNPDQISSETAEKIFSVAEELGYAPNAIAQAMVTRSIGAIGILVPMSITTSFQNPFIAEFMNGVGSICDQHSLSALFVSPYEGSLLKATQRAPVDGFIVLGLNEDHSEIEPLRQRHVRFIIVDGEASTVSQVNIDDELGAYHAAHHLLSKGHSNIMILTFGKPDPSHKDDVFYGVGGRRYRGIQRAFDEAGQHFDLNRMVQSETSLEGGREAFLSAWKDGFHPSAVFAFSDAMAIGVLAAARELGLQVPEDLEVIGFDDIPNASFCRPTLSTVHQSIFEKGTIATTLLIDMISGKEKPQKVLLPTKLVLRESTKA